MTSGLDSHLCKQGKSIKSYKIVSSGKEGGLSCIEDSERCINFLECNSPMSLSISIFSNKRSSQVSFLINEVVN